MQAFDLDLSSVYLTYTPGLPPTTSDKKSSRPKTAKGKSSRPKTAKKYVSAFSQLLFIFKDPALNMILCEARSFHSKTNKMATNFYGSFSDSIN